MPRLPARRPLRCGFSAWQVASQGRINHYGFIAREPVDTQKAQRGSSAQSSCWAGKPEKREAYLNPQKTWRRSDLPRPLPFEFQAALVDPIPIG
jgi:hypothetical protein